jgi:hypothetical protein
LLRGEEVWSKEWRVEFKEYDFTPNPVVQNQVFFLGSKCASCGFSILARSFEELRRTRRIAPQCRPSKPRFDLARMGANVLNYRILNILTLLVMIIPTPALSHTNFVHATRLADTRISDFIDELEPYDTEDCFSLGELDIGFRTDNRGLPNIGVVLTDPRGRRIGFDPLTKGAWDVLPVAQGYIDCDDLGGADTCRGVVQVCGPVTGTYRLEVIAQQTTTYRVSISARSKRVHDGHSLQSYRSEAGLENVAIRARSRNVVLLNYSRDGQEKVTAQLQHPLHPQPYEVRFHRHADVRARK